MFSSLQEGCAKVTLPDKKTDKKHALYRE